MLNDEKFCCDPNGRYIILDTEIQGSLFMIVNICAPSDESSKVEVLEQMIRIIEKMDITQNTRFILGGDFSVRFSTILDSDGGNLELNVN